MSSAPDSPDLGFLRRRTQSLPAAAAPALDLSRPDPPHDPGSTTLDLGTASLDLGTAGPATPASASTGNLDLGARRPAAAPSASPSTGLDLGASRPAPRLAAADLSGQPAQIPDQPPLGFLRRRPPQRSTPDVQRTGNPAIDFSAGPVAGPAGSVAVGHQPVATLRGRTVLDKRTPKVRIGGEQAGSGSMQFTLHWGVPASASGFRHSTDLQLGCLWEMNDRSTGVIQTFDRGSDAASCEGNTVLRLGGRSETEGQTLVAALKHLSLLRRMVLFVYADNGHPDWLAQPSMSVTLKGGVVIDLRPEPGPPWATACALASLHRVGGTLVLRLEQEYLNGQQQTVAEAYGFDLPWIGGRSVPPPRLR